VAEERQPCPAALLIYMHDLNWFRNNLDAAIERLSTRGFPIDKGEFRELDLQRRAAVTEAETLKAQRNSQSTEIGKLKKAGQDTSTLQQQGRDIGDRIAHLDERVKELDEQFRAILKGIPNMPQESVPVGKSEHDNIEVRRWGTPREFSFAPKAHWDLGPDLGILDMERAAKIAGARFSVYWGLGARLERSLINFMLDVHTGQHGYTEVLPPFVVNSASLFGTGNLPKFADDLFKLEKTDYWLAPTAEVPVTNLYRDETLDLDRLPINLCAYTPCFRSEAGSYGRDVRGIIRQHQFQKVELVKFTAPDQSNAEHEKLTADAEKILQLLGLPYRTVSLCTGDLGFSSSKT
jgi:seryl-tRNA synthetase